MEPGPSSHPLIIGCCPRYRESFKPKMDEIESEDSSCMTNLLVSALVRLWDHKPLMVDYRPDCRKNNVEDSRSGYQHCLVRGFEARHEATRKSEAKNDDKKNNEKNDDEKDDDSDAGAPKRKRSKLNVMSKRREPLPKSDRRHLANDVHARKVSKWSTNCQDTEHRRSTQTLRLD